MFLDFYGLKEQPFGVTPDPRFLYLSPSHKEALASLYCSIENDRGFSAMVAPPGMGKTSLLFRLLQSMQGKARTAFLFHPDVDAPQFMQSLLLDVGLDGSGNDFVKMRDSLNRMLMEERRSGRRFVLVVDEAQNLSPEILESIRLLSNFETPEEKLIHIILAGQPLLAEILQRPEMCQLSQRVSTLIGLHPFSPKEVSQYVQYRLGVAGRKGRSPFSEEAMNVIAQESRGVPRNINGLCYQALSIGCALRKAKIDGEVLRELTADLRNSAQRAASVFSTETTGRIGQGWKHVPLREEISTWTDHAEKKSGPLRLATTVAVTAVLSTVFWTMAVPKIKMYRNLNAPNQSQAASANQQPIKEQPGPVPAPLASPETDSQSESSADDESSVPTATLPPTTTTNDLKTSLKTIKDPVAQPGRRAKASRNMAKRQTHTFAAESRVVFTSKQESLFQIALDNYGESNSLIVDKILLANPRFQNRYAIVGEGQRIVLPNLVER